jgi:hypothetical protein
MAPYDLNEEVDSTMSVPAHGALTQADFNSLDMQLAQVGTKNMRSKSEISQRLAMLVGARQRMASWPKEDWDPTTIDVLRSIGNFISVSAGVKLWFAANKGELENIAKPMSSLTTELPLDDLSKSFDDWFEGARNQLQGLIDTEFQNMLDQLGECCPSDATLADKQLLTSEELQDLVVNNKNHKNISTIVLQIIAKKGQLAEAGLSTSLRKAVSDGANLLYII